MAASKKPGAAPATDRPYMPAYGIEKSGRGQKPWSWAERQLKSARNYWLSTVHPDGRPNASAVWGVWLDGRFFFSCAPAARKAKNIVRDPRVTVTTDRADEAVIIEGRATPIKGRAATAPFVRAYKRKYDWTLEPDGDGYFVVMPDKGFAFVERPDQFGKTATRYRFAAAKSRSRKTSSKRP